MTNPQRGQKVRWEYVHCLGVSRTRRVKIGVYQGMCRHTSKHWRHPDREQLAWVQFDGNKRVSRVPYADLIFDVMRGRQNE